MPKMEPPQIDIPLTQSVKDTVSVVTEEVSVVNTNEYLHPSNRNPSEWRIEPLEGDMIRAVNNTSRDVFEGSYQDFNKILRG